MKNTKRKKIFKAFLLSLILSSSFLFVNGQNINSLLGNLTDYHLVIGDGRTDANWQGASKGFIGNVAVSSTASQRTSGTVPYAGTIYTNAATQSSWQAIVNANAGQASGIVTNETARLVGLSADLNSAFTQINALTATSGFENRSSTSLDGLNTVNGLNEIYVINITSVLSVSSQIDITGDAGDLFILRWDTDANFANGYDGQVKFQSGGAIVPHGGLTPGNFIHVAGDINASGGGSNPTAPYPQGPRYDNGQGALIAGGSNFSGGGFFTGYWLTTGKPDNPADATWDVHYGESSSLSNAIFVGGWYTIATKFSMTSGTSGVYVAPPSITPPPVQGLSGNVFHDINGLADNTVNGTSIGQASGETIFVHLLNNNTEIVIDVKSVNIDGTYSFNTAAGQYKVLITNTQGVVGSPAPTVIFPNGWVNTGENLGAAAGNDGTTDSKLSVTVVADQMTSDANFGIQQLPVPSVATAPAQTNPGGNNSATVPAATFTAADPDGEVTAILITSFPSNATSITINGVPYTSGTFPIDGVEVPALANGNPTHSVLVDPVDGAVTVDIPFKAKDNAGFLSTTAGTASQPFIVPDGPTAVDDQATTPINTPVNINILNNDIEGSTPLVPGSISFIGGTEPDPATVGVFTVDLVTGIATFTPALNYVGIATIDYEVCDQNSLCDIATITVTIIDGVLNFYPALGPGTLAYEDLWPGKGDYDFNDLVLDYQFEILINPSNFVEQVNATFTIRAFGASFENGFGFQLSDAINAADLTVTGFDLSEGFVTLDPNGTEANQSKPTIIVYENAFNLMPHPGSGIGVNTTPGSPYVQPVTIVIGIQFKPNTYSYNDLDIANFNPFLIVNKVRGHEVHLPDYPPTDLADVSLFGMWEDDSDPQTGKYYLTANNLPWAINIYESFDYPKEKQEIIWAHLKFAEWATSGGVLFPDWYKNLPGYRNNNLIYQRPNN